MALDQSALLDLLGQLKLTDVTERVRTATETLYQELIDAEATAFIGAGPQARPSRSKPDRGLVHTAIEILNQDQETVGSLTMMDLLRRRPEPPVARQ